MAFEKNGLAGDSKGRKSLKIFEFDNCIAETKGHSFSLGIEQNARWITQHYGEGHLNESAKNIVLLFGQTDAAKSQLLNVVSDDSLISNCVMRKNVQFLRVSMYHLDQEYLLAHKTFANRQQMRREIGMEIREAFRERDLNAKKIALKLSTYSQQVKAE